MNIYILIIAVLGLIWMFVSLEKGLKELGKSLKENGIKGLRMNVWLKDFLISVVCVVAGSFMFIGVTGMVIGLMASFGISAYIEVSKMIKGKRGGKK